MKIYTWQDAPINLIQSAGVQTPPRKNRGGNKRKYQDIVCAFDIETTAADDDHSFMYIWQFQIGLAGTVVGRTWREFQHLVMRIRAALDPGVWLVVYVHNLAFEFQFLRGIYKFKSDEVFAVSVRKPLRADMLGCLEFRCSYLHSNMSLSEYLKKMGVEDQKQEGFDYNVKRYPWTPLSDQELLYCVNDVRGLVEALMVEMQHDHDSLYTIPATSTGYVRRDVRRVMTSYPWHYVHDMLPDRDLYDLLRQAFRGGNTHSNRYYSGQVLKNVNSFDRSSSYPDVQCNCKFPVSPFIRVDPEKMTFEHMKDLIGRRRKAVLLKVALRGVRLRDEMWGCPYLPVDKCRNLTWMKTKRIVDGVYRTRTVPANFAADNGRILWADALEVTMTDVDWKIFISEYEFDDIRVLDLWFARYGALPKRLVEQIQTYYTMKTALKGNKEKAVLYDKNKAKLNSIYGLSAQNPCKISIVFEDGLWSPDDQVPLDADGEPVADDIIDYLLGKYNRSGWFPYQWGVWTTAWARYRLEEGIRLAAAGADLPMDDPNWSDFVYCDTDSVKYIGHVDWSAYNADRMAESKRSGSYAADSKGERHYMGVYEQDSGYPAMFATRGAKKYAVQHPDGKLEATISGVSKRSNPTMDQMSGGEELAERGGIEAFLQPEFTFYKAGGTQLRYNDRDRYLLKTDGHAVWVRQSVTIRPDFYTLSDTEEYDQLLRNCRALFRQFQVDIMGK